MANKNRTTTRTEKVFALITYCIALAALLLGLFLPYGTNSTLNGDTNSMWAFQLPQALKAAIPVASFGDLIGDVGAPFTYSLIINFNGWLEGGYDLGALFTVLYALVALAGLIALVPAIVGTVGKNNRTNIALNAASFIENLALIVVSIFVFIQLTTFTLAGSSEIENYQWSWALVASFGGILLMLIIQSIITKKGSGVIKFILLLMSAITLMVAVYDAGAVIPPLHDPLQELFDKTSGTFGGGVYSSTLGILPVLMFFCGFPVTLTAAMEGMGTVEQTLLVLTFILSLLAIVNFLLDAVGLGKTTKKYMLVSNLIRYALTFLVAALLIMMPLFVETESIGLMAIVIGVLSLIELIINTIRFARFDPNRKSKKKNKKKHNSEVNQVSFTEEPENVPAINRKKAENRNAETKPERQENKVEKRPAPVETKPEVKEVRKEQPAPEKKKVIKPEPAPDLTPNYSGPVDAFIMTLTNNERVEFKDVFIERRHGQLSFIPEYIIGGNNLRFFNSVFIYYSRIREGMSESLLNKMYKYCGMM